jgi:hypothetical protein
MRRLLFGCATAVVLGGIVGCEDILTPLGDPVDLSFAPCIGAPDNPSWVAVQDGDGPWQQVTSTPSGSFDFTLSSGKGGVAMVTPDDGLLVAYATTEEFQSLLAVCNGSVRSLTGNVTGYAALDNVLLVIGTSTDVIFGSVTPPAAFMLLAVDATATDLVAVRYQNSSGGGSAFETFPNNVFIRRNVTGTSTSTVDFSSTTEAGSPLERQVNVTNLSAGEALRVYSNLALPTTLATIAVYEASSTPVSGSVTAPFWGIPAARLGAGESHMVHVSATKTVGSGGEDRFATFVFTNPVDQSMALGPSLGSVTVSGSSRPSVTYNAQVAYDKLFDVVFSQGNGSSFRQCEVLATSGYLDGATSVTLQVPNLAGVSGFQASWLLNTGVQSIWQFLATDAPITFLTGQATTYQGAERYATFTP